MECLRSRPPFDKGMEYRLAMEEEAKLQGRRGSCKAEPSEQERKHTVAKTMIGNVATTEFTKEPVRTVVGTPGEPGKPPPGEGKSKQALKMQARREKQTEDEKAEDRAKNHDKALQLLAATCPRYLCEGSGRLL